MKLPIALIIFCVNSLWVSAQVNENFEQKMKQLDEKRAYSWSQRNFFLDYKFSAFSEYFIMPKIQHEFIEITEWWETETDTIMVNDGGFQFTIASASLEPRINLWSNQKNALFVKSPITLGLSITVTPPNLDKVRSTGVFHFTAPILLGYSKGLNSSYSNAEKKGFSFSGGIQYMRNPVLGGKLETWFLDKWINQVEKRSNWLIPVAEFDYYWLSKKNRIRGLSLMFDPIRFSHYKLALCYTLTPK